MDVRIPPDWMAHLGPEFEKPYFSQLEDFVRSEYEHHIVYPQRNEIFRAFEACSWDSLQLVILGQDPYHGPGQANGLCFSVREGVPHPPSLRNIFKELKDDLGVPFPASGDLEPWAQQGVLLLNATLTVRGAAAGSHQNRGWEYFTDAVVQAISQKKEGIVFLLWGTYAQKKGQIIDRARHKVLTSAHPSPLSAYRGFFGSRPFSKVNDYLVERGKTPIQWELN
jgi:uracil-DNA glycosylase